MTSLETLTSKPVPGAVAGGPQLGRGRGLARGDRRPHEVEDGYREAIDAFAEIAAPNGEARDLDDLLHAIARKLCELLRVRRASVYLRDDRGRFRGQVGHDVSDIDKRVKRLVAGVEGDRFTREILSSMRPVAVRNAHDDPRPIRSTMREWGVVSMLGVPMVRGGEVLGIVFVDDGGELRSFSERDRELAHAFGKLAAVAIDHQRRGAQLRAGATTAVRQNQRLRRSAAVGERLAQLAIDGAGITTILDAVAALTGRPLSFHDSSGERRALARPAGVELAPLLLDAEHTDHPAVRDALRALDRTKPNVVAPLLDAALSHRHLLVPVAGGARRFGELVMLETGSAFTSLDVQACAHAARVVAMQLALQDDVASSQADARAALARDLLRGDGDVETLRGRARALGVDLDRPRVLCIVSAGAPLPPRDAPSCGAAADASSEGHDGAAPARVALADAIVELGGPEPSLLVPLAEGVAVLVALDGDAVPRTAVAAVADSLRRLLAPLRERRSIAVSLSGPVRDPSGYAAALADAEQVLRCVTSHASAGTWLLSADDLGAARLMLASAEPAEVRRFAEDALGAIACDEEHAGNLLSTLQVFFERSRSVKASAAALAVHENTVRYRLGRIHELSGLDVASSSEDQLTAQVALRVMQLQGRRPWSLTPDAGRSKPPRPRPENGG